MPTRPKRPFLQVQPPTLERVRALVEKAAQYSAEPQIVVDPGRSFDNAVTWRLREEKGLRPYQNHSVSVWLIYDQFHRHDIVEAVRDHLLWLEQRAGPLAGAWPEMMTGERFRQELNEILASDAICKVRLGTDTWVSHKTLGAEDMLRRLIASPDESAPFRVGDIQQEMASIAVHDILGAEGALIVDYSAGKGRLGRNLRSARLFGRARYLAVDDPLEPELVESVACAG